VRRLLALLVLLAAALGPLASVARADERSDAIRARIEMIRRLPPDEQARLREALQRFRSLPPEKREELRRRAERVGPDRLRELVGRDVQRLRRRHGALQRERDEIVRELGGMERFAALSQVERDYVVELAVRSFQKHIRRTLLDIAGPDQMRAFGRLPHAERKQKIEDAVRQLEESLIAAETPESRARILALPPEEQRAERLRLLAEHRLSLVPSFLMQFERLRVVPFLRLPPEQRQAAAERWASRARWFEIRRRLETDLGVSRETLRLLSQLGPEEWARVRDEYDQSEEMPALERRLHLEDVIREIHGRASLGDESPPDTERGHGGRERLRRLLRDEHRRRHAPAPR